MADAFEGYQTRIAKVPAQRFGGTEINGAVSRSPHEESRVIANLRERRFQFREVGRPISYDVRSMTEDLILEYGHAVALERIGRDLRFIAEQAAQPQVVERAPSFNRVAEEQ